MRGWVESYGLFINLFIRCFSTHNYIHDSVLQITLSVLKVHQYPVLVARFIKYYK